MPGGTTLTVLKAANNIPCAHNGPRRVTDGMLLHSHLHKLLYPCYGTVTPELRLEVSPRLKSEWQNGREYYAHHGETLRIHPADSASRPSREFITWHNENRFQK
jgi:putative restriction endonuclease